MSQHPVDIAQQAYEKEYKMKTWIFFLLVMAAATSVVNDRIEIPGNTRHLTTHSVATD